jgi:hypothetical protein
MTKHTLSLDDLDTQTALELPERELMNSCGCGSLLTLGVGANVNLCGIQATAVVGANVGTSISAGLGLGISTASCG